MSLPARLDHVDRLTGWSRAITSPVLRDDDFILLEIGAVELINNIIEHAFENIGGSIDVTCALNGPRVTLQFSDAGAAMPEGLQERYDTLREEAAPDATSGRGLGIIRKCFEQVQFRRVGGLNRITAIYAPKLNLQYPVPVIGTDHWAVSSECGIVMWPLRSCWRKSLISGLSRITSRSPPSSGLIPKTISPAVPSTAEPTSAGSAMPAPPYRFPISPAQREAV